MAGSASIFTLSPGDIAAIAHQLGTRTYVLDKQGRVIVVQTDDEIVSLDEGSEVVYA